MSNNFFNINKELEVLGSRAQKMASERFREIDEIAQYNSEKVLSAFIKNGVSESHFTATTGYGYGDRGREVLDEVLAQIFGCEDALIRYNFMSGTHAIATALFGVLRPGDEMVSLTGLPYDTLHGVIGLSGEPGCGSLKDFGVKYRQLDLTAEGKVDFNAIPAAVKGAKVAYIQRSRGYSLRDSLFVSDIEKIVKKVKEGNPNALIVVDNCYGEFVERTEPTQVGADLIIGSLIKNPGGGIAPTGGYIAGRHDLVELCAQRLTAPGVGKEIGCTLGNNRSLFMGLFFAPTVVASALKTATFASALFELLKYEVTPRYCDSRADIIQAIKLKEPNALIAFCEGVQKGAPVDSYVTPVPWDMPGYDSQVIMAAGAFHNGASIELSADAPLREPFAVWLQGGLTFETGKVGILLAAQSMLEKGIINL
ncbi:MAG: methionine gamma-lyase family protein [Oscillospiraceae bacterium]|nr:methionine gamma-lyase family protein [Oscillospiraceae bacterium]